MTRKGLGTIFLGFLKSHYEDVTGDFIERVVTQDETSVHQFDYE